MKSPRPPADAKSLTEFAIALYGLVETVRKEHEEAAAAAGLTAAQATILTLLAEPVSMRRLAAHMGCDPSNITGIIDRLEAKGFVERATSPNDRRVKLITPTRDGGAAVSRFQRELIRTSSLAELAPAARDDLLAALAKVRRSGDD